MVCKNVFYVQFGGVIVVINVFVVGVIEVVRENKQIIGKVYVGCNGIIGVFIEDLIDISKESKSVIDVFKYIFGGVFGFCCYKFKDLESLCCEYEWLIEVFKVYNIGYFFYNGGGDFVDICLKIFQLLEKMGYLIQVIYVFKIVDNDLLIIDVSSGFGLVVKYIVVSCCEVFLDVVSMCVIFIKVFVMEVMGWYVGWIVVSVGFVKDNLDDVFYVILFFEIVFDQKVFFKKVDDIVKKVGYCVIVVFEGVCIVDGIFLVDVGIIDVFGYK